MEISEDVRIGLQNIRSTLHARWNPRGKVVGGHSFDANGKPRHLEYEGRWEIWDTDADGREYRVTQLEGPEGYIPLGMWVVELMNFIDPRRTGGDLHKMVEKLVDRPNEDVARLNDKTYEELLDFFADLTWAAETHQSRVVVPRSIVIPNPVGVAK